MTSRLSWTLIVKSHVFVSNSLLSAFNPKDSMATQKIPVIASVKLITLESFPPKLWVSAIGIAPTSGWRNTGLLIPFVYFVPPLDGIYEFDFLADSPFSDGNLLQIETEVRASFVFDPIPVGLNGVKVYSESGFISCLIDKDLTGISVLRAGGIVS